VVGHQVLGPPDQVDQLAHLPIAVGKLEQQAPADRVSGEV
jgi:hypothetical protein